MTQYEKILTLMLQQSWKEWFLPTDFMHPTLGELFVGYEASARLSEMAKLYPDLIESKREGKYMARKLRRDNLHIAWQSLTPELRRIINPHLVQSSLFI